MFRYKLSLTHVTYCYYVGDSITLGAVKTPIIDTLRKSLPNIIDHIDSHIKLSNDLHSSKLICDIKKDEILTRKDLSRYDAASMLLNEVQRILRTSHSQSTETFITLCHALERQGTHDISNIVFDMLRETGEYNVNHNALILYAVWLFRPSIRI